MKNMRAMRGEISIRLADVICAQGCWTQIAVNIILCAAFFRTWCFWLSAPNYCAQSFSPIEYVKYRNLLTYRHGNIVGDKWISARQCKMRRKKRFVYAAKKAKKKSDDKMRDSETRRITSETSTCYWLKSVKLFNDLSGKNTTSDTNQFTSKQKHPTACAL